MHRVWITVIHYVWPIRFCNTVLKAYLEQWTIPSFTIYYHRVNKEYCHKVRSVQYPIYRALIDYNALISSLTSVFMPVMPTKHTTIVFSCLRIMQSRATPNVCYNSDVLQNLLWIIHRNFWRTSKFQLLLLFYSCQPVYICRKQIYLGYILCTP